MSIPDIDHAEQLSWMDARAALQLLDKLQASAHGGDELVHWLMVRGLAYGDTQRERTEAVIRQLHELGRTQPSAEAASHIVQGYLYFAGDQLDQAETQMRQIDAKIALPTYERYRLEALRGIIQTIRGRHEPAISTYERLRDLANAMQSAPRVFEATAKLAGLYISSGNIERAATLVAQMKVMAAQSNDELQWVEALEMGSTIAEAHRDPVEQLRGMRAAMSHARLSNSDRALTMVLTDLSDFYLKSGEYSLALGYSTEGLAAARRLRRPSYERLASFCMGMAQIGLGQVAQGKPLVDDAIQRSLASGELFNTDMMMRQYVTALEKAGDLRGALQASHRDDDVRERLVKTSRQKALLELSAKFDDERRARQIEILERDNTIKSRDLQAQRLRQQMIVMVAALVVLACGALAWGITRIRRINARWVRNSQRDALTGLFNRRYFNEQILAQRGARPYVGCLLLIHLDDLQRVNDASGYAVGDGVLAAIGARLPDILRDSEVLVRWSGEKFLTMLGPMSETQLDLRVRQLLTAIRDEPVTWSGQSYQCTVSVGYASFPVTGAAVDVSLDCAIALVGKALRQARRRGRDRACLIKAVNAKSEQELTAINACFEEAAEHDRVQLVEMVAATS